MLTRKLFRTMGLYKAQFISMIIMIALGVGIFVGFHMEWVSIEKNTGAFFEQTGLPDYRVVNEEGFSPADAEKIGNIKGVTAVSRFLSVNVDVKDSGGDTLTLTVSENIRVSGFLVKEGEAYSEKSVDGIWLSERYAAENGVNIGDEITLSYKGFAVRGRVAGLIQAGEYLICVRDESQLMPDYGTHGFAYISPAFYEAMTGTTEKSAYYPMVSVLATADKAAFTEELDKTLGKALPVLGREENASYAGASGEIEEGKTMGSVLPVLFLAIAVLTMVTTMHRLTAKEKTQIGTLKALGFRDGKILRHYTSYAAIIGVIGTALGIGLGYAVAFLIMNPSGAMGTYFDMPSWHIYLPVFCYPILAGLILALTLIGFLSTRKMLHGTAADALRPYTPKKMKPLWLERTKLFHRLSFSVRWNLRDIARHKARTLMSLVGIVGCTTILVGSFGMRDTMASFLDIYYNDATRYASRIFVAEDATPEERAALVAQYDGDSSASRSVQWGEKTVSLDIYVLSHDFVRFPDRNNAFLTLADDGAYICTRLAQEYGVDVGDSFRITPYGSKQEYTLRVAGVIRSVSESIVVSGHYAETCGISYAADSVYTATAKEDIAPQGCIKSVQSKQMIIDSFDSFTELMNLMILLLAVAAMVLGVVVLYNLGVMSYTERYREMATLKVVGFRNRKIAGILIGQNLGVTLFGGLVGVPLGILVLKYLLDKMASEYEMRLAVSPLSCLFGLALTFGVSLLVSLLLARKNKNIDMVEALKGAE